MTDTRVVTADAGPEPARRPRRWTWPLLSAPFAWLVFVALHLALSGRVWWWQVPELVPPFAFAVLPVLLFAPAMAARAARGWIAAVTLASLVLGGGASGLNLAALWHRPPPAPPGAITVFSWNTLYWDMVTGGATMPPPTGTPSRDVDAFYRYLHDQKADVYLLQEYVYFGPDSKAIRVDDLARMRREFPGYHIAVASEMVTLSRFPIVAERGLDLRPWLREERDRAIPPDPGLPGFSAVKTLRTDVRVGGAAGNGAGGGDGGKIVSFYSTHINSPVHAFPSGPDPRRLNRTQYERRLANLRALADDVERNPHPVVLAGDFNASPAMGILRLLPDRLVDATPVLGSLYPTSWDDRWPLWRIDWAFTTPDVTVHRYGLVRSEGLSDHSGQHLVVSTSG
ncbi:endonuclease/exonuclease/phosphatase family protein [Streptosporangium sp. NPDC048865]|uniref:endonuclease/exonuclease/phosphatase family protein n=1 Tax=Streptosporangium sp. NPDC048865 TaxID=3155766 RepID=UPI0034395481